MKVKVIVKKGFGVFFATEKIQDGSVLNLPATTAKELVKGGYVDYADDKEADKKEVKTKKEKK